MDKSFVPLIRRGLTWEELTAEENRRVEEVIADPTKSYLILSEPRPTFTYGVTANRADLLWDDAKLDDMDAVVRPVVRGGQWTYHGPGQILIYPILNLERHGINRRAVFHFMRQFRASVLEGLAKLGVAAEPKERPFGIYANQRKIASFGMAISRGVTSHGMALYHDPQAAYFSGINPCGVCGELVTSLRELGVGESWEAVATQMAEFVKKGFICK